jgi:hypothetical protein
MPNETGELLHIEMREFRREMHQRFDSLNRRIVGGSALLIAMILGSNLC